MDKLFEGLEDNTKLTVKEMKSRFLAYDAEKKVKEDELRNQMNEMNEMLKSLRTESGSKVFSQVFFSFSWLFQSPKIHRIHRIPHNSTLMIKPNVQMH